MKWHVGQSYPLDVYDGDGLTVCQCRNADAARRIVAAMNACFVVKDFLNRLEEGTPPEDPLRGVRVKYHAPLHAALDAALEPRP
jgi:hypothetical protein